MEKRGLGRGLAALISESAGEDRSGRVQELKVEQIAPNPYQPRTLFDPVALADLENSIREHGILQPILVREIGHERYQIVAGERRFRAAQNVGLRTLPAIIKECSERDLLELALVENVQREDINPMEQARAYQRMLDEFELTQEGIAQRVGKSRSGINNSLRLLNLPEEIQDSIERGEITEGHGRALLMAERTDAMVYAWKIAVQKGLSVREVERLAKQVKEARTPRTEESAPPTISASEGKQPGATSPDGSAPADPNEAQIVDWLQQALKTKVTLRRLVSGGGRIEIEFYSPLELERLVEILIEVGSLK